jgi:hypothetical protein
MFAAGAIAQACHSLSFSSVDINACHNWINSQASFSASGLEFCQQCGSALIDANDSKNDLDSFLA